MSESELKLRILEILYIANPQQRADAAAEEAGKLVRFILSQCDKPHTK